MKISTAMTHRYEHTHTHTHTADKERTTNNEQRTANNAAMTKIMRNCDQLSNFEFALRCATVDARCSTQLVTSVESGV